MSPCWMVNLFTSYIFLHDDALLTLHRSHVLARPEDVNQGSTPCAIITLVLLLSSLFSHSCSLHQLQQSALASNWGPDVSFAYHTHTSFSLLCSLLLSLNFHPSRISSSLSKCWLCVDTHTHTHIHSRSQTWTVKYPIIDSMQKDTGTVLIGGYPPLLHPSTPPSLHLSFLSLYPHCQYVDSHPLAHMKMGANPWGPVHRRYTVVMEVVRSSVPPHPPLSLCLSHSVCVSMCTVS